MKRTTNVALRVLALLALTGAIAGFPVAATAAGSIYAAGTPPVNAYVCNGMNGQGVTRAAGPCFDNVNRYVNCHNGTVTDTVTGLIWLQQADCLPNANWA